MRRINSKLKGLAQGDGCLKGSARYRVVSIRLSNAQSDCRASMRAEGLHTVVCCLSMQMLSLVAVQLSLWRNVRTTCKLAGPSIPVPCCPIPGPILVLDISWRSPLAVACGWFSSELSCRWAGCSHRNPCLTAPASCRLHLIATHDAHAQ